MLAKIFIRRCLFNKRSHILGADWAMLKQALPNINLFDKTLRLYLKNILFSMKNTNEGAVVRNLGLSLIRTRAGESDREFSTVIDARDFFATEKGMGFRKILKIIYLDQKTLTNN